jgi:hypothetical protein
LYTLLDEMKLKKNDCKLMFFGCFMIKQMKCIIWPYSLTISDKIFLILHNCKWNIIVDYEAGSLYAKDTKNGITVSRHGKVTWQTSFKIESKNQFICLVSFFKIIKTRWLNDDIF